MSDPLIIQLPHDKLIQKLRNTTKVGDDELAALRALPLKIRHIAENADVVREGDRPSDCCLLLEGMLFRYKVLSNGSRQILSFHVPGDIPDLQSLHLKTLDHNIAAVAPSVVAYIPHDALMALTRRFPEIGDAFWRDTLIDGAVFREWVVNTGGRNAYERLAHLFCELFVRLKTVGLTQDNSCQLPLTQSELADATGVSVVHLNRTLQELRREGLVVWGGGRLTVPDWEALERAGDFSPGYLHLDKVAA